MEQILQIHFIHAKENITQMIEDIGTQMDEDDIFIFYFAGHGIADVEERGFLVVGPEEGTQTYTLMGMGDLSNSINALPGNHVVILDSCYSGNHVSTYPLDSSVSSPNFDPHTFTLAASTDEEPSYELENVINGETHGYFTLAILDYLGWKHNETTTVDIYTGDNLLTKQQYSVTGHIEESSLGTITLEDIADSIQKKVVNKKYNISSFISQNYMISSGPTNIILFDKKW